MNNLPNCPNVIQMFMKTELTSLAQRPTNNPAEQAEVEEGLVAIDANGQIG